MSEGIAQGLYLEASAIDHSCVPNAVWSYQGKEMIIRTINNVEDFSDLRISYLLKLYENTSRRRQKLLKEYYFLCNCSRGPIIYLFDGRSPSRHKQSFFI